MSLLALHPIFDLADQGVIKLPPVVARHRARLEKIAAIPLPENELPSEVPDRLICELIASLEGENSSTIDYFAADAAEAAARARQAQMTAMHAATLQLETATMAAVAASADEIVCAMQPIFQASLEDYRQALGLEIRHPGRAALEASPKIRHQLGKKFEAKETIENLLAARSALWDNSYRPLKDIDGEFGLVKNADQIWPRAMHMMLRCPWAGPDPIAWLVGNRGEPWLPTVAEQDARFEQVHGDSIRSQQQIQSQLNATRASYSGGVPNYATAPAASAQEQDPPQTPTTRTGGWLFGESAPPEPVANL